MLKQVQAVWDAIESGRMAKKYRKFINIQKHLKDKDLIILNYTNECQKKKAWDSVTTNCRGLILNVSTGEIVALPFSKFFNLGERPETQIENLPRLPFVVQEKVDGFFGVLYRGPDGLALSSRGSFVSEMAKRGTDFLRQCKGLEEIPQNYTFLFEIIYPNDKLAIKYGYEGLVLLAIMDRFSGAELKRDEVQKWAEKLGVRTPRLYPFTSIEEAAKSLRDLPADLEGYVARFTNNFRVKLKGRAYLERFRLLQGITEKRIREILIDGQYDWWISEVVPEEFWGEVEEIAKPLILKVQTFEQETLNYFSRSPKDADRKTFALWVKNNVEDKKCQGVLYLLYEGKKPNWYEIALKE